MKTVRNGSRRDFLRQSFAGAALLCASGGAEALAAVEPVAAKSGAAGAKSRVVVAHDELLRGADLKVDSGRMLALLDRAMQAMLGQDHPLEAWKSLASPGETVSLKVEYAGRPRNLNECSACCGHLRTIATGRRQGERHHRLGPRQQRTGARRFFISRWAESACNVMGPTAWAMKRILQRGAAWAVACRRYSRNAPVRLSMFPC